MAARVVGAFPEGIVGIGQVLVGMRKPRDGRSSEEGADFDRVR